MLKRMVLMLAVTTAVIAVLGFKKFREFEAAGQATFQPPPEAVTTVVVQEGRWPVTLNAIGTVAAVQGVAVSADLPGIVDRIAFDSGQSVHEGDILVQLDTRQEQAQLDAVKAQRELARLNFERLDGLVNEGAISRAEYDRAAADQKQTEAGVGEIQAAIARKTIRAPFSGVLGLRLVNLGQYLSSGNSIVTLQSLDPIYVNFGVPQDQAGEMRAGRQVRDPSGRRSRRRVRRRGHRDRLGRGRGDSEHQGSGHCSQSARHAAARDVRSDGSHGGRRALRRGPAILRR